MTQQTTAITEKELFTRSLEIEREILMLQEDLKELKLEATYHEEQNPSASLDKETVAIILKASKAKAKDVDLLSKIEELQGIDETIKDNS